MLARLSPHVTGLVRGPLLAASSDERMLMHTEAFVLASRDVAELRPVAHAMVLQLPQLFRRMGLLLDQLGFASEDERPALLADALAAGAEADARLRRPPRRIFAFDGRTADKVSAVDSLVTALPDPEGQAVVNAVIAMTRREDEPVDPAALRFALPLVPPDERKTLVARILPSDVDLWDLCTVAEYLSEDLLERAVDLVGQEPVEPRRVGAPEMLAPWLSAHLLRQAAATMASLDVAPELA